MRRLFPKVLVKYSLYRADCELFFDLDLDLSLEELELELDSELDLCDFLVFFDDFFYNFLSSPESDELEERDLLLCFFLSFLDFLDLDFDLDCDFNFFE